MDDLLHLLQAVSSRPPERRIDAAEAERILAAAECVATAAGRPPAQKSEALSRWHAENPTPPSLPLMTAAIKAVDRLLKDHPSKPAEDVRARLQGK